MVFFEDIIECIQKINEYIENVSETEFDTNTEKQDAVIRRIEIIGEAVKSISSETRKKYPYVLWREMTGMRDIVIHEYFGVSVGLVWRVVTREIPKLEQEILEIIKLEN